MTGARIKAAIREVFRYWTLSAALSAIPLIGLFDLPRSVFQPVIACTATVCLLLLLRGWRNLRDNLTTKVIAIATFLYWALILVLNAAGALALVLLVAVFAMLLDLLFLSRRGTGGETPPEPQRDPTDVSSAAHNATMRGMQPENRFVTAKERSLIEWLLRHGKPGSEQFLQQLDSLVVVSKCSCGCPTVYFAREGESIAHDAEHILADYLATVNGEDVGIILFQRGGRLSSLEVYSQAGTDESFGLPELDTIYSYEELPESQRNRTDGPSAE